MTEHDIYRFYNEKVKIIYAEIEARDNTLPVELLFEIHAAFDHLKRIHIDGEAEMAACEKAYSHLKRGLLDAFKLKLKYHNKEYELLTQKKGSLRLIDSGQYLPALLSARKELVTTAKRARINEGLKKGDDAFDDWYSVSLQIDEIEKSFFEPGKIEWANQQALRKTWSDWRIALIGGFISGVLATCAFALLTKLISIP